MAGDDVLRETVIDSTEEDFAVASEDTADFMFVGQKLVWKDATASTPAHISKTKSLLLKQLKKLLLPRSSTMSGLVLLSSTLRAGVFLLTSTGFRAELRLIYATGLAGAQPRPPNLLLAISEN